MVVFSITNKFMYLSLARWIIVFTMIPFAVINYYFCFASSLCYSLLVVVEVSLQSLYLGVKCEIGVCWCRAASSLVGSYD